MMKRKVQRAFSVPALLAVALFAFPAAGGFTEAEFQCEEAASKLDECCPELGAKALSCSRETGCAGQTLQAPVLAIAESECIEELECEQIREDSICERVAARQQRLSAEDDAAVPEDEVCP